MAPETLAAIIEEFQAEAKAAREIGDDKTANAILWAIARLTDADPKPARVRQE